MDLIKNTSLLSDSRFPMFIRGNPDFDPFKQFVKSYFESLEEEGKANHEISYARENSDVDSATTQNLDKFFSILCPDLPVSVMANKTLLLKHARELYQKKGTPESYKLLFKIMFNENANLQFFGENVLRASDGKWIQPIAIHVRFNNVSDAYALGLVNQEITCINASGIVRNNVVAIKKIRGSTAFEIQIDRQKNKNFKVGDVINIDGVTATIIPSTTSVRIIKSGSNFRIGQIVPLNINSGTGSFAKVSGVNDVGGITKLKIIRYGTGYESDFTLTVSASLTGVTEVFTPPATAVGATLPLSESMGGFFESGSILQTGKLGPALDYFLEDYVIMDDYTGTVVSAFGGTTGGAGGNITNPDDYAMLSISVGAVLMYPGLWSDNKGKLSDPLICIQDNELYQNFSYLIQSAVSRDDYYSTVKTILHPAGMAMFSDFLISSSIDISTNIAPQDGLHYQAYINDIIDMPDDLRWHMESPKFDVINLPDDIAKAIETIKEDSVEMTEINYYFADDYCLEDYVDPWFGFVIDMNKAEDDTIQLAEDAGAYSGMRLSDTMGMSDSMYSTSEVSFEDFINPTEGAPYSATFAVEDYSYDLDGSIKIT